MVSEKEQFVVDEAGERVAVILNIAEYNKILDELDELDSIKAYDTAKATDGEAIPLEQAFREIEQERA